MGRSAASRFPALVLPLRSVGVHEAPLGRGLALFDEVTTRVHVLDARAALVWDACDGATTPGELASVVAEVSGAPVEVVAADVAAAAADLGAAGLVGRPAGAAAAPDGTGADPAGPAADGRHRGARWAVGDEVVELRSDDPALAVLADALLAPLATTRPATVALAVARAGAGVRLAGRGFDATLPDADEVRARLVAQLNRVVAEGGAGLALHAGAVEHPSGAVVVLPAPSGSGKSTLTAGLVAAGWRYLTDEAVGLEPGTGRVRAYPKPLALDDRARTAVGRISPLGRVAPAAPDLVDPRRLGPVAGPGEVRGRPALVVLPRYAPDTRGADLGPVLAPGDALPAVAVHALNLARVPAIGLRTLADLAEATPCRTLVHGDLGAAVAAVEGAVTATVPWS